MFGFRLKAQRPAVAAGQALFEGAVRQARSVEFYRDMGVPDTLLGRFELYTLHVLMLARRLRGEGAQATETAQAMFDAYRLNLDIALREMGVGDLSVGKKMKKLGRAFYGRVKSWDEAAADPDAARALVLRTVYEGVADADPAPLTAYIDKASAALAGQSAETFLQGQVAWPGVAS